MLKASILHAASGRTWASIRELAVLCHCHRRAAVKASHSCTVIKVPPTPRAISMAIPGAVSFALCFRWAVSWCALKRPLYHCFERAHTTCPDQYHGSVCSRRPFFMLHLGGEIDSYMAGILIFSGTQLYCARAHSHANVRTHSHTITRILIFFGAQLYYTQLARACAHALAQHNE